MTFHEIVNTFAKIRNEPRTTIVFYIKQRVEVAALETAPKPEEVMKPATVARMVKTPWVPNTRGVIAALLLGVAMDLVAQVAERLDTAFFAGTAVPFGYVNAATWMTVAALLYGPIGGIIAGVTQGVLSAITATSPLSPVFIFWNFYQAGSTGVVAVLLQPMKPGRSGLVRQLVAAEFMNFATSLWWTYHLIVLILGLPLAVWFTTYLFYVGFGAIPIALFAIAISRAILRSGVLR